MKPIVPPTLIPELYCSNIKNSLDFYIHVLGFHVQYQREEEGFAMIERQSSNIMLEELKNLSVGTADRIWLSGPLEIPFGRGINLQIETDKIETLYDCVRNTGAKIFLPMEEKWYRIDNIELGKRQFIVLDPDGYMLRFSQNIAKRDVKK